MPIGTGPEYAGFVSRKKIEQRYMNAQIEAQKRNSRVLKAYIMEYELITGKIRKFFHKLFNAAPEVKAFQEELSKREEISDKL